MAKMQTRFFVVSVVDGQPQIEVDAGIDVNWLAYSPDKKEVLGKACCADGLATMEILMRTNPKWKGKSGAGLMSDFLVKAGVQEKTMTEAQQLHNEWTGKALPNKKREYVQYDDLVTKMKLPVRVILDQEA